tara:strand:+ start:11474 stop:11758 length:285 start_codon:yes stop_codon:yes gene_type:complete
MNRPGQFVGKDFIDQALPGNPVEPGKGAGGNFQMEMAFPFGPGAGMPGMFGGLVNNLKVFRGQFPADFFFDNSGNAHIISLGSGFLFGYFLGFF